MAKRAEKNQLGLVKQILSQSVFLGGEQYVFLEKEAGLKGLTVTQMANRIIDQYRDNRADLKRNSARFDRLASEANESMLKTGKPFDIGGHTARIVEEWNEKQPKDK